MASLRTIKKDIDFLVSEVISDCWVFMYINPEEKTDEAVSIINDAVVLRNELFERVNSKEIESPKKHYKAISQDLLKGVDALFIRISGLTK
ncbi:MAG: hypothetical protein KA300_00880 [Bacteroidales bacterium]|jgi:hypothetical protein|nr:hypothetical protein [Bacteroidales bacterium]MBP6454847.1 hypothetical protein [Bacteroidales bacterium]MBP8677980.1 hypothetical protein [Bacteroidales bacterium]MBP9584787.1 hypothetical protein [Bacteroidales bacterium]MBP9978328.1 hypothetical protein [Bacteroidales bacterium]